MKIGQRGRFGIGTPSFRSFRRENRILRRDRTECYLSHKTGRDRRPSKQSYIGGVFPTAKVYRSIVVSGIPFGPSVCRGRRRMEMRCRRTHRPFRSRAGRGVIFPALPPLAIGRCLDDGVSHGGFCRRKNGPVRRRSGPDWRRMRRTEPGGRFRFRFISFRRGRPSAKFRAVAEPT